MIPYYLQLRTLSPLSITRHNNIVGLPNPSLNYIPGSTLRGAIAWQQLQADPQAAAQPAFQALFDHEELRCAPLYPLSADGQSMLSLPLPLTARTCKHLPGFRQTRSVAGRGHGVWDTLVAALEEEALARLRLADPPQAPNWKGLAACERCDQADCHAPLQRYSGYMEWITTENRLSWRTSAMDQRLLARTALLPTLETARPGALFTREAVDAGQRFAGVLTVTTEQQATLESFLAPGTRFSIGAGRTAGLGRVEVVELIAQWDPLVSWLGTPTQRLAAFANRLPADLRSRWSFAPLTLLSDTILLDHYLRVVTDLSPATLVQYWALLQREVETALPAVPDGLELFLAVNATHRVAGWNTTSTPPRPRHDDLAIAAGSVFVLAAPAAQAQALADFCQALEGVGLGERRAEGFGRLAVALPVHSQAGAL